MTQNAQMTDTASVQPTTEQVDRTRRPAVRKRRSKPFWRRPWILPLAVLVIAFLAYELPPYLGLDPSRSRVILRPDVAWHYPLVIVHIVGGTIALLTVVLQVWPWLRQHHPVFHRWTGRVYVFLGAIPSALAALAIVAFSPTPGQVGVAMAGVLWLGATVIGYRMARRGRYADHRRWMLYSFAIVTGLNLGLVIMIVGMLSPVKLELATLIEAARWVGWVVNLMIVHWWLRRTASRPVQQGPRRHLATQRG